MTLNKVRTTSWCVVFAGSDNPRFVWARDVVPFGYPQMVSCGCVATTVREAMEALAIEPHLLDWTVPASHREPVGIGGCHV